MSPPGFDDPVVGPGLFWGLLVLALLGDGCYRLLGRAGLLPRSRVDLADRIGLRILLALTAVPFTCVLFDSLHVPIGRMSLSIWSVLLFACGMAAEGRIARGLRPARPVSPVGDADPDARPSGTGAPRRPDLLRSPAALVLASATAAVVIFGMFQALWVPVRTYDALVGFDLIAKVMAFEGKIRSSVFDRIVFNAQSVYAPFTATNSGFWYIFRPSAPALWVPLLALGFLLVAWRQVRDWTGSPTAASLACFLMLLPKPFTFALTVPHTDLPAAAFCALAIFAGVETLRGREGVAAPTFYLLAATTARSENVLFALALAAAIMIRAPRTDGPPPARRSRLAPLWIAAVPLAFFAFWNLLFVRFGIGYDPGEYFRSPGVDPARMAEVFRRAVQLVGRPELYGEYGWIILILPLLWAAGRIRRAERLLGPRRPDTTGLLLVVSAVLFCAYMGFFYLWNEDLNPLWTMEYTFKRGFLRFIPGIAAAFVASPPVLALLRRCE